MVIELKKYNEKINGNDTELFTVDILKSAVGSAPVQGLNIAEMMARSEIMAILKKHKEDGLTEIEFTPEQIAIIKISMEQMAWALIAEGIIETYKSLE